MEKIHKKRAWSISLLLLMVCSFLLNGILFMMPYARTIQSTTIGSYSIENAYHISEAGRSVKRVESIFDIKKIDVVNEYIVASTFGKLYSFNTENAVFDRPYHLFDFGVPSVDEKIKGDIMFRVLSNRTMQILNFSSVAQPTLIGSADYPDQIMKIEVGWLNLFSVNASGYLQIRPSGTWNGDPSAYLYLNSNQVTAMVRDGRRMIIGTDGGWLFIVSILSESTLVLERIVHTNQPINDIAVFSDLIILGTRSGLFVYNTIADTYFTIDLANIRSLSIQNDLIYAACEEYLIVLNIKSTQEISIITALDFDEQLNTLTVNGLYAYIATISKFYILKVAEYLNPIQKFRLEGADYIDSECSGRMLYITGSNFNIYQRNGLSSLREINLAPEKVVDIEIEGNIALILLDNNTLQIYNISNPGAAWLVSSHSLPPSIYKHMKVEFNQIIFASQDGAVYTKLNDLYLLETPTYLNYSTSILDIAFMIGRVILASTNTISIWDISGMMPELISNIQVQNVRSIELDYPSLYVGTLNSIKTYNIANLNNPVVVSEISTGEITDMEVNRDFLLASDLSHGLSVFNRSNPFRPIYLNSTNTQGGVSLSLSGEFAVYTCDYTQYRAVYGYLFMNVGAQNFEYLWNDSSGFDWMNILRFGLPTIIIIIICILVIKKVRRNGPKFKKMSSELKNTSIDQLNKVSDDFFDSEF